jgi:predicted DNA-binding protein
MKKKVSISIKLEAETARRLKLWAKETKDTVARIVRLAVENYLETNHKEASNGPQ